MIKFSLLIATLMLIFSSNSEADPLSEYDCQNACNDCQKGCQSLPAGSQSSNCAANCSAGAAGCCVAFGKKPPGSMSCYCN
jgi:hypothetical protein